MSQMKPIESVDFERAKYREDKENRDKILLLALGATLIFIPFLFILPLLMFSLYTNDRTDFENPYVLKWRKDKFWMLMYVLLSFYAFYFLIFPLVPTNVPLWGLWSQTVITRNIILNTVFFVVATAATLYFTIGYVRPYFRTKYHKYRELAENKQDYIVLPTKNHGPVFLKELNTGIMVIGKPGSGKTQTILQIINQLENKPSYAWVIFDPKGDYVKEFGDKEEDIILSIDPNHANYAWNIFKEIAPKEPLKDYDIIEEKIEHLLTHDNAEAVKAIQNTGTQEATDVETNLIADSVVQNVRTQREIRKEEEDDPIIAISEIMGELFKELTETSQDKFWNYAAQQVLEGYIYMMYKEALNSYKPVHDEWEDEYDEWKNNGMKGKPPEKPNFEDFLPTNADLYERLTTSTFAEVHQQFMKYPELRMIATYLNPKAEKMAGSVWAVLGTQVKRIFQGAFGPYSADLSQISMKEYMRNPAGRKLFVLYDVQRGEVLGPIYRVLVDRLIAFGFERGSEKRKKYFIIDEFQNVPKLTLYQNLVNYGRSYGMTSVIGIQALSQVITTYGKDITNSVVAGHNFVIAFSMVDNDSRQFLADRIGKKEFWHQTPIQVSGPKGGSKVVGAEYKRLEYTPLNLGDISYWPTLTGVLITREGFKKVELYFYKEALPRIRAIRREIKQTQKMLRERRKVAKPTPIKHKVRHKVGLGAKGK